MMKWTQTVMTALMIGTLSVPLIARAEVKSLADETASSEKIKDAPEWITALKNQHHLSDEHIEFMQSRGLSYPEMSLISTLSEKSGKTVEDILEMKTEEKKDWDGISKELDISPDEVSRSIASTREEVEIEKLQNGKKRSEADLKECVSPTLISCNFTVSPSEVRSSKR